MNYLIKIDRLAAWVLFACIILYFVSGYGMLTGIVNPVLSTIIHTKFLTYIALISFAIHTSFAIGMALKRWNIFNLATKILLLLFYIILIFFVIWANGIQIKKITNTAAINNVSVTLTGVAKHNTAGDCWLIVNGKVYNVTNFIPMHNGGTETIVPYCGKDATMAFETKNGFGSHSQRAQNVLNNYYVGNFSGQ